MTTQRPPPPAGGNIADLRAEFARLTRATPIDPGAKRAFIESKIALIMSDPNLSDDARRQALAQMKRTLKQLER